MAGNRRAFCGQEFIEGLLTCALVLVIIGIVALALWHWNELGPESTHPGCAGFSDIKPVSVSASGTNLTLAVGNEADTGVGLRQIDVSLFGRGCSLSMRQVLRPGESASYTVQNCRGIPGSGEYWNADITIRYINISSGLYVDSVGECYGTVGR